VDENFPGSQLLQRLNPNTGPKAPGLHDWQSVAPFALENVPVLQNKHTGAAGVPMYCPATHNVHAAGPCDADIALELEPAGQVKHPVNPEAFAK